MRTTLTLDPDVALQLKRRMAEEKSPMKRVVNEALRVGLCRKSEKPPVKFKVKAFPMKLRPGIDPDKLNQLTDELETLEILRKLHL